MKNVRGDGILIIPVIIKYMTIMTVSSITAEENSHAIETIICLKYRNFD